MLVIYPITSSHPTTIINVVLLINAVLLISALLYIIQIMESYLPGGRRGLTLVMR